MAAGTTDGAGTKSGTSKVTSCIATGGAGGGTCADAWTSTTLAGANEPTACTVLVGDVSFRPAARWALGGRSGGRPGVIPMTKWAPSGRHANQVRAGGELSG